MHLIKCHIYYIAALLGILLFFILCSGTNIQSAAISDTPQAVLQKTFTSVSNIHSLSYKLSNTERIDDKLLTGEQFVQLSLKPFRCYLYFINPSQGSKALYVEGTNNNELIYAPNGFPYTNLSLDPNGSLARKNNHHSIFEVGFGYITSILKYSCSKSNTVISIGSDIIWENQHCYTLIIENPLYGYTNYTVKKGENILSIARKLYVSEYHIMKLNSFIDSFNDVNEDQTIRVPNMYAKKIELYINKQHYLPLVQKIYDDKGLYEKYEYYDLKINPNLPSGIFTEEYLEKK